jgi:plastocyanin
VKTSHQYAMLASILSTLLTLSIAPGAANGSDDAAQQVEIKGFAYAPSLLTVSVGTTITWKNLDEEPHLVMSTTNGFHSQVLDTDQGYSFKFDVPGTYEYFCSMHPYMKGTIKVVPKT